MCFSQGGQPTLPEPIAMCFSGGKDSSLALLALQHEGTYRVETLITTVTDACDRVSMHGVRRSLLRAQAASLGAGLAEVVVPPKSSNEVYERAMAREFDRQYASGIRRVAFGDICLEDLREYRERQLAECGLETVFPIWGQPTDRLARSFIRDGFEAVTVCVSLSMLDASFAGRAFDTAFLADLPPSADPCGENGEFHTFVSAGPIYSRSVPVARGEVVERDRFRLLRSGLPAGRGIRRAARHRLAHPTCTRVTTMSLAQALQGVKVLDLSRLLPGPFLTMILADLGADVVKVEEPRRGDYMRGFPPRGDGASGRYLSINRNKRSVTMDLKDDRERERFLRMAERADVVVESFRPGVVDRLGVGYAALSARNERIILCSISGYGQTGPYRDRAGHDINYLALAGVLGMSGQDPDGPPALAGVQIADLGGGAMWGAIAILAAIVDRERTGRGAHLDISMTEGALALLASEFGIVHAEPSPPTRGTGLLNGGAARYGVYATSDGKYLSVGALEPQFLGRLAAATGLELRPGPESDADLRRQLTRVIATRTRDEWARILAEHDCCCEPVLELDEVPEHVLHRKRGLFFEIPEGDPAGTLQVRTAPRDAGREAAGSAAGGAQRRGFSGVRGVGAPHRGAWWSTLQGWRRWMRSGSSPSKQVE